MKHLEKIQRIIAESLLIPGENIQPDQEIADLKNIDSLSFEMIIVGIETETGKALDPMDLMHLRTVGDLAKLMH